MKYRSATNESLTDSSYRAVRATQSGPEIVGTAAESIAPPSSRLARVLTAIGFRKPH